METLRVIRDLETLKAIQDLETVRAIQDLGTPKVIKDSETLELIRGLVIKMGKIIKAQSVLQCREVIFRKVITHNLTHAK